MFMYTYDGQSIVFVVVVHFAFLRVFEFAVHQRKDEIFASTNFFATKLLMTGLTSKVGNWLGFCN